MMTVFWDVAQCSLVEKGTIVSIFKAYCSIIGDSEHFRNVDGLLPHFMVLQRRRQSHVHT